MKKLSFIFLTIACLQEGYAMQTDDTMSKQNINKFPTLESHHTTIEMSTQEIKQKQANKPSAYIGNFEFGSFDKLTITVKDVRIKNGELLQGIPTNFIISEKQPLIVNFYDKPKEYIELDNIIKMMDKQLESLNSITFDLSINETDYKEVAIFYWGLINDKSVDYYTKHDQQYEHNYYIVGNEKIKILQSTFKGGKVYNHNIKFWFNGPTIY